jgi:hypothetical protein
MSTGASAGTARITIPPPNASYSRIWHRENPGPWWFFKNRLCGHHMLWGIEGFASGKNLL